MERKPINTREMLNALVQKFGGVETARFFLADALSDIQTIDVGLGENNPLLAAKSVESLRTNLTYLRELLDNKDNKPSIEKGIRDNISRT